MNLDAYETLSRAMLVIRSNSAREGSTVPNAREASVLIGRLADALHNIPRHLRPGQSAPEETQKDLQAANAIIEEIKALRR